MNDMWVWMAEHKYELIAVVACALAALILFGCTEAQNDAAGMPNPLATPSQCPPSKGGGTALNNGQCP